MTTNHGWVSDFRTFYSTGPRVIRDSLQSFLKNVSTQQIQAWDESIPSLQEEAKEASSANPAAANYTAILEYQLPLESRRPDVIVLENGAIVVLEIKSKAHPEQADLDQINAYVRDLRCYHRECAERPVFGILVLMHSKDPRRILDGSHITGPNHLDALINELSTKSFPKIEPEKFLDAAAYSPLPTLVQAARELFISKKVRVVWRASALTDPAVNIITSIAHNAANTKTRHLVLITGVPGSGKTLVGLRLVHAGFLDDLVISRQTGKPSSPAVFLSGNGPLVEVLQYELRSAGGAGKTFVRGVKDYISTYAKRPTAIPPEHLLVFDEAQRAWDAHHLAMKHTESAGAVASISEPEHFIEFADRIPEWCVVVGLIGEGQEINRGEEGGIVQWRHAVEHSSLRDRWRIHIPQKLQTVFENCPISLSSHHELNLDTEIRYHLTSKIHLFVEGLLEARTLAPIQQLAQELFAGGYRAFVTRSLEKAKNYAQSRYHENPEARYGLLASARDKFLNGLGIDNTYQGTKNLKVGPWYSQREGEAHSCRNLQKPCTEFQAQGLELDLAILCWGTDFIRSGGKWDSSRARGYAKGSIVKDPYQLRLNSYRVLLTRGRDGTVVFLPSIPVLDETHQHLLDCGFRDLDAPSP